ncbi:hypothetical protein AAVH_24512 [Aphelenchoides avenae]|nr:hypothetical protein AAVH_24512 [Aphelenchus avenae]
MDQYGTGWITTVRNIPDVSVAYLGIVLPAGAKKSLTAFKYYDGSKPNPLTWVPGRPSKSTAHNLVYCDINRAGSVADSSPTAVKHLICKKAAVKVTCPEPGK